MILVKNFCYGCSLKTGASIIGVVSVIASSMLVITGILHIAAPHDNVHDKDSADINNYTLVWTRIGILTVFLNTGQFIVSTMLLIGASYNKPSCVKPWVIYTMVALGAGVICCMIATLMAFKYVGVYEGLTILFSTATATVTAIYFIIIVHSFYFEMYGEGGPPRYTAV